jgi:hypothetical protein
MAILKKLEDGADYRMQGKKTGQGKILRSTPLFGQKFSHRLDKRPINPVTAIAHQLLIPRRPHKLRSSDGNRVSGIRERL